MDVCDDIGAGDGEDVAVVEEVFLVFFKAITAGVLLIEFIATDGGAHGSIKDHDAF